MICPYCGNETEPVLRYHERGDCPGVKENGSIFITAEILCEVEEKMEKETKRFEEELNSIKITKKETKDELPSKK